MRGRRGRREHDRSGGQHLPDRGGPGSPPPLQRVGQLVHGEHRDGLPIQGGHHLDRLLLRRHVLQVDHRGGVLVGNTSLTEAGLGAHLHFSVAKDGEIIDPAVYLDTNEKVKVYLYRTDTKYNTNYVSMMTVNANDQSSSWCQWFQRVLPGVCRWQMRELQEPPSS